MRSLVIPGTKQQSGADPSLPSGKLRQLARVLSRLAVILFVSLPLLAGAQAQSSPPASSPTAPLAPAPLAPSPPTAAPAAPAPPLAAPPVATPEAAKPNAETPLRDLAARPALRLRAQSTWDQGFETIRKSIELLGAEAARLGLLKDGNPLAHFIDSADIGFTFEAYIPLAVPPTAGLALPHGIEAGSTPAGRGLSFPHEGAYDELDAAYEAITALLDDKGFAATGQFIEEYIILPEKSDDPALRLNVFVFLR